MQLRPSGCLPLERLVVRRRVRRATGRSSCTNSQESQLVLLCVTGLTSPLRLLFHTDTPPSPQDKSAVCNLLSWCSSTRPCPRWTWGQTSTGCSPDKWSTIRMKFWFMSALFVGYGGKSLVKGLSILLPWDLLGEGEATWWKTPSEPVSGWNN